MEYDDTVTIITGKLIERCIDHLICSYINVKHKIISTWKDQDSLLIEDLSKNGFTIILNDYPEHKNTVNYQITCIRAGLLKAQEMGFKYAVRSRTDIFPNNQLKFIDITRNLYNEKITVIGGIKGEYPNDDCILDLIVSGHINEMLIVYEKIQLPNDSRSPEQFLLETYFNQDKIKINLLNTKLNSCLNLCKENKIEFTWYRILRYNSIGLSFPYMKIIKEYCAASFICAF
jgi:hypothetical protein